MRRARPGLTLCALAAAAQVLADLTPLLPQLRFTLATLASLVPATQFYRYSPSFSQSLQNASFIVVISTFLEREEVASKVVVQETLGSAFELRLLCEETPELTE